MGAFSHLCGSCGKTVPAKTRCPCQIQNDRARKARHDRNRPSARERGYTSAWEDARLIFLCNNPRCVTCGKRATVVDHKIPHRGDTYLFWDQDNWQALCTSCHSRTKQRLERRSAP